MKEKKERKKLKDTKVGIFLKDKAPGILNTIGDVLPDNGAFGIVKNLISNSSLSPENKEMALRMLEEENKTHELSIRDRESARLREVELAKTGKTDWLMYVTGVTALLAFLTMIGWAMFGEIEGIREKVFFHILGFVEGTALSIFAYYFGSSKGSSDKNKYLSR